MLKTFNHLQNSKLPLRTAMSRVEAMEKRLLLSGGTISGTVYNDVNGSGLPQPYPYQGLAGRTVYADLNNNGAPDASEPSTTTDSSGNFTLTNLPLGFTIVRQVLVSGERQSYPAGGTGLHVTIGTTPINNLSFDATTDLYIQGNLFGDNNNDGTQDNGEKGIAGAVVYADLNNDGVLESNEPVAYPSSGGQFVFYGLSAGTYVFRAEAPTTQPLGGPMTLTLGSGAVKFNANIAVAPVTPGIAVNSYGDLDTTFGKGEGQIATGPADGITALANGQFLLTVNTTGKPDALVRYNSNGSIDTTYGTSGLAMTAGSVAAVYIQGSGDIVVTGDFNTDPGYGFVERFLPSGKLDTSFGAAKTGIVTVTFGFAPGDGAINAATVLPLSSGQFIIGGSVDYSSAGDGVFALERFNLNGAIDTTFGPDGTGAVTTDVNPSGQSNNNAILTALGLTATGEILTTGYANGPFQTGYILKIAEYSAGGILDTTFGAGGVVTNTQGQGMTPLAIRGLANGQFMVAGEFVSVFGASGQIVDAYGLRYNADGSLDTTYGPIGTTSATNPIYQTIAALIYPDGSILLAGYDATRRDPLDYVFSRDALFKVDSQGSPDFTFNGGSPETILPEGNQFDAIALTADQHILAVGRVYDFNFTTIAGVVARYLGGAAIPPGAVVNPNGTLTITGTGLADNVTVNPSKDGKSILATINGVVSQFMVGSVKGILVNGLGGDDSVSISSAVFINSTIFGGEGNDTLSGGSGNDLIYGNDGNDVLLGNAGNETLHGGNGDDSLNGGLGNDLMFGEAGNDNLNGGLGNDSFYGGDGNDTADYSDRPENLLLHIGFGKQGAKGENDYIAPDIETLIAGSGNDVLNAYLGPAELVAGSGTDTLISGHGYATLIGGSGNDLFETKNKRYDTILGGSGNNSAITDYYDTVTNVKHRTN